MAPSTMRFFFAVAVALVPVCSSFPVHYLMGRPSPSSPRNTGSRAGATTSPTPTPTPTPSPTPGYGIVLDGQFLKLDSRVPVSSCPQFTTQYLEVVPTADKHLRVPHSRIETNGIRCGDLADNATTAELLNDKYMELISFDSLLDRDTADAHGVLGAYKKLVSHRAFTHSFYNYLLKERTQSPGGPSPFYVGYERYSVRTCGDVSLGIQSLIFFGTVTDMAVKLTELIPRLQQGQTTRDVRLGVGKEFHVSFTPNGSEPEHVCPSVLRRVAEPGAVPDAAQCFPGGERVVSRRGPLDMADVRVGDALFDGAEFSAVVLRTHADGRHAGPFVRIAVAGGGAVRASRGHYLATPGGLAAAGRIARGMALLTPRGPRRVTSVRWVRATGLYNVQTASGLLAVGGVVASCYTTAVPPFVAHALLAPVRAAHAALSRGRQTLAAAGDSGPRELLLRVRLSGALGALSMAS